MVGETQFDRFSRQRQKMVAEQLRARGIRDERVLAAMERVPRHLFVSERYRDSAYEDHPLPIGEGQTISQPYIVAFMLEALALNGGESILEVGTGSGYVTALLAELARWVYSVERIESLGRGAELTLKDLEYRNVSIELADGSQGWPEHAPFDAIVVSAASRAIPQPLLEQLREAGRLIAPVGPPQAQELMLICKERDRLVTTSLEGCRFVPLIADEGHGGGL